MQHPCLSLHVRHVSQQRTSPVQRAYCAAPETALWTVSKGLRSHSVFQRKTVNCLFFATEALKHPTHVNKASGV